ncbi:[FeFe] hydrogenase H-cluster radical SAM maturase HydG [Alkaliphilus transvaalensis]|uniref:[FeFe] hydrogenase H-cluster radical SAM maturase HydG n=1 Tax=Alkaliphilus transvaalensis TaxID=114628 RepID=UPI00047DC48B|nr:[FeFe] hydrogenase H-cluster radical SAM maturase HydG [Alkaliphilus transvaalensis]
MNTHEIINEGKIHQLIKEGSTSTKEEVLAIIEKAKEGHGLNLKEAASLLMVEDPEILNSLMEAAQFVKEKIYGKRVVIFTPLYTSNECTNNCLYCGFRVANKHLHRKTLTTKEIVDEAKVIVEQGHKRLLLVCGEDPKKTSINHITEALEAIYKETDIRRINVNAAPMEVEDFKKLKEVGIGTYQIFQETYHRETYGKMHPSGSKKDYDYRLTAIERAMEAGIDDFGIGVLLGLYDYRFDVLATLMHSQYMDDKYHVGPHTISVPRLRPANDSAIKEVPYEVKDEDFKKVVAVYRLTLPYTGIILSTRESVELRDALLSLGVSQMSAGSKTNPGGYGEEDKEATQFETSDERKLDEILQVICQQGYLPSFCTACYRANRTGEAFMNLAKEAEIHEFCQSNAILTFKEHLLDYGSDTTNEQGNVLIEKALKEIENDRLYEITLQRLKEIEEGKRDLFF